MVTANNKSYRQFLIDFNEKDKNPVQSFLKLKYFYSYSDICNIVDNLGETNKTFLDFIYGRPLPTSIRELGDCRILYGDIKDGFEAEINWLLLSIRKYSEQVQLFIDKKIQYENCIIIGDYKNASIILDEIENNICISLWGIEQRFILIEIEKGLKENTKYLNEINEKNKKWFIKRFSHFFSLKAEKELSVNQYNLSLARLLFRYLKSENNVDLLYYTFKLDFLETENQTFLPDFLAVEGHHSIIDKYLSLIRIFKLVILENDKNKKDFLDNRLYYLSKKINDFEIIKLRILINTNFDFEIGDINNDLIAMRALDCYTNGDYEKAELLLRKSIEANPLFIELYEVYIKTLILLNKTLETIGEKNNSFQNRILKALFNIFSRNDNINDSLDEIRKIAYNLSSFHSVPFYLINFYKEEVEGISLFKEIGILNTSFINPTLVAKLDQSSLNKFLPSYFTNSISLEYLTLLNTGESNEIENSRLSTNRKLILQAYYYQKNSLYDKAIKIWERLVSQPSIKYFQKERILQNLFKCREAIGQFDECIDLYVNNYFINHHIVSNIKVDDIKKKIKNAKYLNVKHSINLPLFFKLTNSEDYDIHTAYECFLISLECFTPTEFIKKLNNEISIYGKDKLVFFLDLICTLDIFKHSPFITSSTQKHNERIDVCKFLYEIDIEFKDNYLEEIEWLTKRLIIQKGIQEIDESKIYVNQNGIIESELKNIESNFNRFKMIGELKSENDISIISLYSDKMFSFKYSETNEENEFSKDPQFDIYKDIFYFLRDKFLFSNYGLQQYLSARIRHGILLGEIRPEFESLNLITEKEKGIDKYKENKNWELFTSQLSEIDKTKFQSIFSEFSSNIDDLINEEILSKSLQIKIEDNNVEGWLDYNFEDLTLKISYLKNKNVKEIKVFVNSIFEVLWERTKSNLEGVKFKINGNIKDRFFELLLKLEQGLLHVFGIVPKQIENHINEARVNIENKLIKIANWFTITESNISDFMIDKIVDVSLEYNRNISPIKYINFDGLFKGVFYPALVDLFRIFMHNAIKHSGIEGDNIMFYITINKEDEILSIQFRNPLTDSINVEELKTKICSFSLDLNKSMKEGRSGFHKAMRIIKTDLLDNDNDMTMSVNQDNEFCVEIRLNKNLLLV